MSTAPDRHFKFVRRQPLCEFSGDHSLHPLLVRVLENRGAASASDIDYSLANLEPPDSLLGIEAATSTLERAIEAGEQILVLGDYDVDGATATTLTLLALRAMGAAEVRYLVPNRFDYGYGLSAGIAREAVRLSPDLVITVDNGISSLEGARVLADAGIRLLITDHHLAPEALPDAEAIVNPNQPGCPFPDKALSGVGVMFYVLLALRQKLRERGHFASGSLAEPNLAEWLDLVALGTVADVVPLAYNNRILVEQGIRRIRAGRCRPGIRAILSVANRLPGNLDASDLGFAVGPRLNAAGRMDDISVGIECLLTDDESTARKLASQLDEINLERQQVEATMQQEARDIVARLNHGDSEGTSSGLCLYSESWHQGVTGLVASRMRESTGLPVVAFAPAGDGVLRGSARSVGGLHIRDLLAGIDAAEPGLVAKFGGHAMAAGLTLNEAHFDQFSSRFDAAARRHFETSPVSNEVITDGELQSNDFVLEVADMLRLASPWGQRFPVPLFDGEFTVVEERIVGERHLRLKLRQESVATELEAIAFRYLDGSGPKPALDRVRLAYQLQANEFRGRRSLQLLVEHLQPI